jgi:hypothetical protein
MKLLLGGSDLAKLENVRTRLLRMGVACDIVYDVDGDEHEELPSYPELWVQEDEDFETALLALKRPDTAEEACRN